MTAAAARPARREGGLGAPLPIALLVFGYLLVIVLLPLSQLILTSLRAPDGGFTLEHARTAFTAPGLIGAARNSLFVSVVTTLLATSLGAVLAWLVGRTDLPGRTWLRWAVLTPFVIPPFVGAIAWLQLLGGAGWINQLARQLPFVERTLWNVRGEAGIIFVLTLTSYPLAYVTILGALSRLDPSIEEGARISGAGLWRTLRDVTLPVMRPAIASGAILVFIYSMANFGVPAVLGFTENYYVLTTRVYALIARSATPGSLNQAAALAILLGLIAIASVGLQRIGAGRGSYLPQRSAPDVPLRLGAAGAVASAFCWVVVAIAGVAPLLAITLSSLTDRLGRLPLPGNLTLDNYVRAIVQDDSTARGVLNSLILAFCAGVIVVVLGAIIGYLSRRTELRGRQVIDALATFPYALPGTVVAVAVLMAFLRPIGPVSLFNTLWIILVAYLMHYMAYGIRATSGALALMDPSLEEASRISGATRGQTFWRIVVPLLRPALFAGFFLVFVPTLRELTISALLWSPGNETIGVVVFTLQEAGETQAAAAVAVLMLATVGVMNVATRRVSGGRVGY